MKFSFVIPSINQFKMLFTDCLDSFHVHHGHDSEHEIIVVDDGSEARLQTQIAQECVKRGYKFLINKTNEGFPKTVNKGMREATGDIIVLVNNDVVFTHNVTKPILKAFDLHPKVGIVGALLHYPPPYGKIQHGGIISTGIGSFTHRAWHKTYEQSPEIHKTEYLLAVTGALFAIKREAMEDVGYLNEHYFLACDDTEYCLRFWEKDWRIVFSPEVRAIHCEGITRGNDDRSKLMKSRHWYIKERETMGKFNQDVQNRFAHQWQFLIDKVGLANREIQPILNNAVGSCDKKYYGKGLVTTVKEEAIQPIGHKATGKIIAIRRTGALGDVLLTTGIVKKIKEEHPEHELWFVTVVPDIFKNNPYVSHVVRNLQDIPHPIERVIDLDNGYEKDPKCSIVEAYAKIALPNRKEGTVFAPEMYSTDADAQSLLAKVGMLKFGQDKIAVIHCAVGWPSRTFPRSKWNEITKALSLTGYRCVIIGRGADYRSDLYAGVVNCVDQLTLHEIRELMKKANVFLGMDSGMMHIAMTTSVPVVGIFTVADPDYRMIPREAKSVALVPKVKCRFCLHDQTPPVNFVSCQFGTNFCLEDFKSNEITAAVNEVTR